MAGRGFGLKWTRAAGPLDGFVSWRRDRSGFLSIRQRETASASVAVGMWATGCVVHHVHSPGAGDCVAPDRHRRSVGQRLVRASIIVEGDPSGDTACGL